MSKILAQKLRDVAAALHPRHAPDEIAKRNYREAARALQALAKLTDEVQPFYRDGQFDLLGRKLPKKLEIATDENPYPQEVMYILQSYAQTDGERRLRALMAEKELDPTGELDAALAGFFAAVREKFEIEERPLPPSGADDEADSAEVEGFEHETESPPPPYHGTLDEKLHIVAQALDAEDGDLPYMQDAKTRYIAVLEGLADMAKAASCFQRGEQLYLNQRSLPSTVIYHDADLTPAVREFVRPRQLDEFMDFIRHQRFYAPDHSSFTGEDIETALRRLGRLIGQQIDKGQDDTWRRTAV